ncbi:unnamed protein product [Urochloa decumbens]|uniref:RING-type domain-containing protein n=1 Tax=Urochloa decumbens TaxID=240449 RepID=A0ABC8YKA6_9POAL
MGGGAVLALQIAAGALVAALLVAVIVAAAWGARDDGARRGAAVHDDVERALGAATITTYQRAAAAAGMMAGAPPTPEGRAADRCAICLSDYAGSGELVRVVPACGHFFHAECGVDGWLRARRTCPLCRGGLWPLPPCPPVPPKHGGDTVAAVR